MSSTYTAIYAAAKCFHQQGSEKYGQSSLFEAFISDDSTVNTEEESKSHKGTQTLAKVSNFRKEVGNRAHVTLQNGAAFWYHRTEIQDYINASKGENLGEMYKTLDQLLKMNWQEQEHLACNINMSFPIRF